MAEAVKGLFYRLCRNSVKCLKFSDKWSENFGTCTQPKIPIHSDGDFLFENTDRAGYNENKKPRRAREKA